jgi:hypothetical protein
MDALTPTGRLFGPCDHEHRSDPGGSPCLLRPHFQPFRPQPLRHPSHGICSGSLFLLPVTASHGTLPSFQGRGSLFPHGCCHGLCTASAGSPVGAAESGSRRVIILSTLLRMDCSPPAAATSCCHDAAAFGFRRVNFPPDGDLHPAVWTPSQAHACPPAAWLVRENLRALGPSRWRIPRWSVNHTPS